MSKVKVYPWSQVASDLATDAGFDWSATENKVKSKTPLFHRAEVNGEQQIKIAPIAVTGGPNIFISPPPNEATEREWEKSLADQKEMKTHIATRMWGDIIAGKLLVRHANGEPMTDDPKFFEMGGAKRPHLTENEGNDWLKKNRYLEVWKPAPEQPEVVPVVEVPAQTADTKAKAAPKVKKPPINTNNWKMKIQSEAASRFKRLQKSGASPTVHSIVGDIAKWCRDNDVKTDGGIYPSANYLRTHVLGGKHWAPPR